MVNVKYTHDLFMEHANNICRVIKKETGFIYTVEQVNEKKLYDIVCGNCCIEQSSDYNELIGFLTGTVKAYRNIWSAILKNSKKDIPAVYRLIKGIEEVTE